TAYPKVEESLKLAVEEHGLLGEPASSSGTLSSLQHLSKDISFGDIFFSDRPSDADKSEETKVESMVNVLIQQAMSSISLMTSPIIDLTLRPESPKEHKLDKHGARLYTLEQLDIPQQVSIAVSEVVTDVVDWAMQAPLRNRFRDIPKADKKEILHQRMWETESYKIYEDHTQLVEALEKSMNRDHSEELAQELAEARNPSKGSAAPSPSKTASSAEYQAWTTTDVRLRPSISLTRADLEMDEDIGLDEQAQLLDDKDIRSAHIPNVNLRQDWWKPLEEERPATPKPAWLILPSDTPVPPNKWASALASNYSPPPEDSLLAQTGDMAIFIDWFCKRRECHKLLTDSVDDPILRNNVSKPLPLGGPPGQVTIQSDFFFNKDLEYLRYGSKGSRPALSISKMKATYYPEARLEQLDKYEVQMMMHFNEIHKFSDGTLQQIDEKLDYRVKEFRIHRINLGLNTRF
nr:hypothetical protein [Tanacetum cinerariifolium]